MRSKKLKMIKIFVLGLRHCFQRLLAWNAAAMNCKLEWHSVERIYLQQRSPDGSVNKTILKPRLAL